MFVRKTGFRKPTTAGVRQAVSNPPGGGVLPPKDTDTHMNTPLNSGTDTKLILRGIHLSLTEAMKTALATKAEKLFRHEPRMVRLRIDVERDMSGRTRAFIAKGRIEIAGPDMTASVRMEDAYAAINLLIDKLDRMLRKRNTSLRRLRAADDIRAHAEALSV